MDSDRSSQADEPQLIGDRHQIAVKEAENTLRQFDFSMAELNEWLSNPKSYRLKPSTILKLNRYALEGVSGYAGVFRPAGVKITGSTHRPVDAADVPEAVEELCEYISSKWESKTAIHLAAYALWRLNWIHPFVDGNGRTARAVSYLVLCAKIGGRVPGKVTIPEQIAANKGPYYKALEEADAHYRVGKKINVESMERMLDAQLAAQLISVHEDASGSNHTPTAGARPTRAPNGNQKKNGPRVSWHPWIRAVEEHPVIAGGIILLIVTLIGVALGN